MLGAFTYYPENGTFTLFKTNDDLGRQIISNYFLRQKEIELR